MTDTTLPVIESRYPAADGGQRFRLSRYMLEKLQKHPLGDDIILLSAGEDFKTRERRVFELELLPSFLVAYCTAGSGDLVVNDIHYNVRAGDLIALRKGTPTFLAPTENGWWTFRFLVFGGNKAKSFFTFLGMDSPIINIGVQPKLAEEMATLISLRNAPMRVELFIEGCCRMKHFLATLAVNIADTSLYSVKDDIDRSVKIMQDALDGHLQLEQLASSCGMSLSHYIRQFKARNGQTPIHYYLNLKMQRACDLLETTKYDVQQVAKILGYVDPYYFSRIFKRIIGISPINYRHRFLRAS